MSDAPSPAPDTTGAVPALEGYFYQLDVSILIALELVLIRQVSSRVVLEPVESKEDLELDFENEPQLMAEKAELDSYRLIIQCKLRNTGPWKVQEIANLLTHGKRRPTAAARLSDDGVRYLLVTTADLDGVARGLRVAELGDWPVPTRMPRSVADVLPKTAAGRVAVLSMLDREKAVTRIKDHLSGRFRVPYAHFEACHRELRDEALRRMLGAASGQWAREDLHRVIVNHGGFTDTAEALHRFVRPKNWDQLRQILATHHAIILTGPSGTGKTRTAQALIASMRDEMPGIAVCEIRGAPEKIEQEKRRPVVFDVDDPWGRFEKNPDSTAWNGSIHSILQSAGPDRKFVITNRSDIYEECGPKANVRARFIAQLEARHYGRAERERLFQYQLQRLPARLQKQVVEHWDDAQRELELPLEIERYFTALMDGMQPGENQREYFSRCLRQAHQDSIEHSILLSVRQRNAFRWAAVTWALFTANPTQSFATLPLIQGALNEKDVEFEDGLIPFVTSQVAGRNLRQAKHDLSYHHPRVELGLRQAVEEKLGLSSRVLLATVETLIGLDEEGQLGWGLQGAVRLVAAARRIQDLALKVGPLEQAALDQWICVRLSSPGEHFQDELQLAKVVGSRNCAAAEIARWLTYRSESKVAMLDEWWRRPSATDEWVDWISSEPATSTICAAFIRRLLARDHGYYRENFAREVLKLAPDLVTAFRDAAMENAHYGYTSNARAIAYGALSDLEAFEPVLATCLDHLTLLRSGTFDDEWVALTDGHYDDEDAENFEQSIGGAGHTAGEFVSSYVAARRKRTGWAALRDHPRRADLLNVWISAAGKDRSTDDREWTALAACARGTEWEGDFWAHARLRWSPGLAKAALTSLVQGGGHDSGRIALAELLAQQLKTEIASVVRQRLLAGIRSFLELACDLAAAATALKCDTKCVIGEAIARAAESVDSPLDEAVRIGAAPRSFAPGEAAQAIWRKLDARGDRRLQLTRVRVLMASGDDMSRELEELLEPVRDSETEIDFAVAVIEQAIQYAAWPVVEGALGHRFAAVRQRAMSALCGESSGPLPHVVLELAADKSHRVRAALLKLLAARRHVEHMDALVTLAADTWTPDYHLEGRRIRRPNAQGAAELLAEPPALDEPRCERLLHIALKLESERVSAALFSALIRNGTAASRRAVLSIALQSDTVFARKVAARALVSEADHVESALLMEVTDAHLLQALPRTAFALTTLVALRADTDQVMTAAKALAAVWDRRILLIPLYLALSLRDIPAAKSLLGFLPTPFASALEQAVQGGPKLARDAIAPLNGNTLGGEILVEEALNRLSIFEAPNASS